MAVIVVPTGMLPPTTCWPTYKLLLSGLGAIMMFPEFGTLSTVCVLMLLPKVTVWLLAAELPVRFDEIVITRVVGLIAVIVEPAGMLVPETVCPTASPLTEETVIVFPLFGTVTPTLESALKFTVGSEMPPALSERLLRVLAPVNRLTTPPLFTVRLLLAAICPPLPNSFRVPPLTMRSPGTSTLAPSPLRFSVP